MFTCSHAPTHHLYPHNSNKIYYSNPTCTQQYYSLTLFSRYSSRLNIFRDSDWILFTLDTVHYSRRTVVRLSPWPNSFYCLFKPTQPTGKTYWVMALTLQTTVLRDWYSSLTVPHLYCTIHYRPFLHVLLPHFCSPFHQCNARCSGKWDAWVRLWRIFTLSAVLAQAKVAL